MKSEATIKKWIKELQDFCESEKGHTPESRIAYANYHLLRRVVEDVVGWPSLTEDVKQTASLMKNEF